MKKTIKFSLLGILMVILFSSCREEFLEEFPQDAVPEEDAINSVADLQTGINGIMSNYNGSEPGSTGEGFVRDALVIPEAMSDNTFVSITNSNRFVQIEQRQINSFNGFVSGTWFRMYTTIKDVNFLLEKGNLLPQSAERDFFLGQAHIIRAMNHFYLVNLFSKQISSGLDQELGIPYVTTFDAFALPQRSTVPEVYQLLIDDFEMGIELMGGQSVDNVNQIGIDVANLLLSRAYLYMQDWDNALLYAERVIDNSGLSLVSADNYRDYWINDAQGETIFQVYIDPNETSGFDNIAYIYDPIGYSQNLAYSSFVDTFSDADVRNWFQDASELGDVPAGFYIRKHQWTNERDVKVLRLSEAFLNAAEAAYQSGDEDRARDFLNALAMNRYTDGTQFTSSGQVLLNDILEERRKELLAEGHRLFDLLRYGEPAIKPSNCFVNCDLPFYDNFYVLPIPESELDVNPGIGQNPGY